MGSVVRRRLGVEGAGAPLFRFRQERPTIVAEVSRRVYKEFLQRARMADGAGLDYVLNDTAYHEILRLGAGQGPEEEIRSRGWWRGMSKGLSEASEQRRRQWLRELIEAYVQDVAGQFNPAVYGLATKALPVGLGMLFKAQDLGDLPRALPQLRQEMRALRDLSQRVSIQGEVETLRQLAGRGTLLFVPTHTSNMDSILVGYSLWEAGLPPVTYGAGKNLFANPLMGFFMHNLGAYKVDRRIKHTLYKSILKMYSQVLLEHGYHSLFFPGGTRCRSNVVESKLKLGLLGTAVTAYTRSLMQGGDKRIFICPLTINYNLVLEAESLIRDHLRSEGRHRYFLEDDPFDQFTTVARFVMNTMRMDSRTIMNFGKPLDPFGNRVEADGQSYDTHGRLVDPRTYVQRARDGEVTEDEARDRQYTAYTGKKIAEAFARHTVITPTQLVSFALFEMCRQRFPRWDVYRVLRMGGEETFALEEIRGAVGRLQEVVCQMARAGTLEVDRFVQEVRPAKLAEAGLENLRMFHVPEIVDFAQGGVRLDRLDLPLLLWQPPQRVRRAPGRLAAPSRVGRDLRIAWRVAGVGRKEQVSARKSAIFDRRGMKNSLNQPTQGEYNER